MSAAGLERVNVTQSQLFKVRAVNSVSSTIRMSGNRLTDSLREDSSHSLAIVWAPELEKVGPRIASRPGIHTRGSVNPSGKRAFDVSFGSSRRFGPAAAITTLDPSLSPMPE